MPKLPGRGRDLLSRLLVCNPAGRWEIIRILSPLPSLSSLPTLPLLVGDHYNHVSTLSSSTTCSPGCQLPRVWTTSTSPISAKRSKVDKRPLHFTKLASGNTIWSIGMKSKPTPCSKIISNLIALSVTHTYMNKQLVSIPQLFNFHVQSFNYVLCRFSQSFAGNIVKFTPNLKWIIWFNSHQNLVEFHCWESRRWRSSAMCEVFLTFECWSLEDWNN